MTDLDQLLRDLHRLQLRLAEQIQLVRGDNADAVAAVLRQVSEIDIRLTSMTGRERDIDRLEREVEDLKRGFARLELRLAESRGADGVRKESQATWKSLGVRAGGTLFAGALVALAGLLLGLYNLLQSSG